MELKHPIPFLLRDRPGISPGATIRLAWAVWLSQYVDSTEVVFGTTETGLGFAAPRMGLVAEPVILLMRIQLHFERTVEEEIESVWDEVQRSHFDAPVPQNPNQLEEIRSSEWYNHSLLFVQLPGRKEPQETSSFVQLQDLYSLFMACELSESSFNIRATFNPDVVTGWQTSRILYQFAHVLQQINKTQSALLIDLTVFSPEDSVQLRIWNGRKPKGVESCVHELIGKHCLERPEALAVCSWDGDFTYGQLDELSSSLSMHLISLGVRTEVFVPLYFEKSRWMTVAMVAVIKAGGAFVLLDLSHPLRRLQDMCKVVKASLVISSAKLAETASSLVASVILVGNKEVFSTSNGGDPIKPSDSVQSSSPLCVEFTSGSTRNPKGVVLEHGGFCSFPLAIGKYLLMNHESRVFQFASYAFDASILENTTLISGGCVYVPSEEGRRSNIQKAIHDLKANWGFFTPSVFKLINADSVPTLQTIVIGGETVPAAGFESWVKRVASVFTVYGPTECCPMSSSISLAHIPPHTCSIGYGRGTVLGVVDRNNHDKLMPIGAVGELLIEGPNVGREYVNEPQKTVAAFIKDPAWLKSFRNDSHRLYKTGDLVRHNTDGSLQYISRKDTQVKIRGQRVELGEIEHHQQKNFHRAATVIVEFVTPFRQAESSILIAFVWLEDARNATGSDAELFVKSWGQFEQECVRTERTLCSCLPKYMVPTVFIPLSKVPLTLTGKIDRRLLRDRVSGMSRDELGAFAVLKANKNPPTTNNERTLQNLVAQVLHLSVESFGMNDNFLHIGGDSLSAMKLIGDLDDAQLEAACEVLVQQHSILRTLFLPNKGALIQVVLKYLKVPFLRQKCKSSLSRSVEALCTHDATLTIPPGVSTLQFNLVTLNRAENTLIIRLSQAQYDGTSMDVLLRNLADLYQGKTIAIAVDFPSYIYHIRTHISVAAFSLWRNILRGSSMTYVGDMFNDTSKSKIEESMIFVTKSFPSVKAALGTTLATLVKAAWSLTLMDYSGRGDVVFGQIVNGRALALEGVDKVVGPCLNEIPVRVK